MRRTNLLHAALLLAANAGGHVISPGVSAGTGAVAFSAQGSECPPFEKGSFNINAYQLYPENMDWDAKLCQVYIGILFNASFGVYDPYRDHLDVISFPGHTRVKEFHVGGVAWDKYTGLATVIIGQGNAFETAGANISGDNIIKKYDPRSKTFLWSLNITEVAKGEYGGFNDITHTQAGDTYFCGTYPSSILKVDPKGTAVVPWYLPETINHTVRGYSGIASHGDTIITLDSRVGKLFRFDATAARGTPTPLPHAPEAAITGGDAIRLPLKYKGKVLLIAENGRGVSVLRSRDASWKSAEYLGLIPMDPSLPSGALTTSMTQIGQKIYAVTDWFSDQIVAGTVAGNKTSFPMVDITAKIDALLG